METCDLCKESMEYGKRYSPEQFRTAVRNGLRPRGQAATFNAAIGSDATARWIQLAMASTTDWALCPSCVAAIESHLQPAMEVVRAPVPTPAAVSAPTQAVGSPKAIPTRGNPEPQSEVDTVPPQSFWSRWAGIYFSPGETLADVVRKPDFILPLVVSIVSALVITETMLAKIGIERIIRNSIEQSGRQMSAEQMEQAVQQGGAIGLVMAHVGAFLGPPFVLALIAALGLGIVNVIYGGEINFKTAFSVSAYVNLVNVLGVVMAVPMILLGDPERFNPQNPAPTNLGFFLNPLETSKSLMAFAGSLDIFSFWTIALLAIGFSAATQGKTRPFAIGIVFFGLWLIYVLAKVGLAMI
jgi:hypothetical protein